MDQKWVTGFSLHFVCPSASSSEAQATWGLGSRHVFRHSASLKPHEPPRATQDSCSSLPDAVQPVICEVAEHSPTVVAWGQPRQPTPKRSSCTHASPALPQSSSR